MTDDRREYREVIDRLVESCRDGQGQIGPRRARSGLWNRNADIEPESMPDQAAMNDLLRRLSATDREVLASMLEGEFISGVHEVLVVLHEQQIVPFEDGYEGTPFHDFVGRLDDWPWPTDQS